MSDLHIALRMLRKSPGFTAAAVLALALGIGANTTVFSLIDRLLLRPIPGAVEADRVVEVAARGVSYPAYRDAREQVSHLSGLAAYRNRQVALRAEDRAMVVPGLVVSGNYFAVLGARTVLGRPLTEADDRPDAPAAAVISHGLWQRVFGGDPNVVGRTVALNDAPVTVVGVAGPEVRGTRVLYVPDVWIPIAVWPTVAPPDFAGLDVQRRTWNWLTLIGRLAPGATPAQAQDAFDSFAARQRAEYPDETATGYALPLVSVAQAATGLDLRGPLVGFLALLAAVAAAVLLITCANIANLLIARAATRRREMGLRRALGATRARLVRQLLTETALLAGLGAALALVVAGAGLAAASRVALPGGGSLAGLEPGLDWRVVGVSAALAVIVTLLAGLLPAWQAADAQVAGELRGGIGEPRPRLRARSAFLALQVALCLVLLVGAGLFTRSLRGALADEPGFRPDGLALASVHPGLARQGAEQAVAYHARALAAVGALPGIRSASWVELVPLTDDASSESFGVQGYEPGPDEQLEAEVNAAGPAYFRTMGIPILYGREFDERDDARAPIVAIVNRTFADRYFAGRDPLGGRIELFAGVATVVGIAADHVYHALGEQPQPYIYIPLAQGDAGAGRQMTLVARVVGDPAAVLGPIADALTLVDPRVPITELATGSDLYAGLVVPQRLGTRLLGLFSALALLLAAIGIHGVVAYAVRRSTREIGVRMALGAQASSVVGLFVRRGLVAAAVGVVVGFVPAVAGARLMAPFLYDVGPGDPLTFGSAAALLLGVAMTAAWLPARRAARIDPMEALRHE